MCDKKVIYVVDDNPPSREIAQMVLGDRYTVVQFKNGEEAYRRLATHDGPCLILTDFHMPVMDGAELIKWIRSEPRLARTPIVGIAGTSSVYYPGADEYLIKPYSIEKLDEVADKWVPRHKPYRGSSGSHRALTVDEAVVSREQDRASVIAQDALWYTKGNVKQARAHIQRTLKNANRSKDSSHLKRAHTLLLKREHDSARKPKLEDIVNELLARENKS